MKRIIFISLFALFCTITYSQKGKAIFLHHSTGSGVYNEGNVPEWVQNYNTDNGTSYTITERSYPNSPWEWKNYPYDFWKLWIDGSCKNSEPGIECLESLAKQYELIILKHCFPGAHVNKDTGSPDITSSIKSLENYKVQYRALREKMDAMPNNKFMFWTLAPLHRLATNSDEAEGANEFVEWVKNEFLTEDGKAHPNIYIFDFFGAVAELKKSPANGVQYCLKYDFEKSHDNSDSHPNKAANEYAGPLFAKKIVEALSADKL